MFKGGSMLRITGKGEIKRIGGSTFVRLPPDVQPLLENAEYNIEVVIDKDKNEITITLQKPEKASNGGGEQNGRKSIA